MHRLVTLAHGTRLIVVLCLAVGLACAIGLGIVGADGSKEAEQIAGLVRQLGHKEFAKREAASKELDAIGEPALPALRKAISDPDAEIRQRAEKLVVSITGRVRAAAARKELEKLQGTWYTISTSHQGAATGEDRTDTITYEGTEYVQRRNGQEWAAGTIEIVDATVSPKQIEYTPTWGLGKGMQFRSIYTLDGDDHQICSDDGNNNRPREFSGKAGFHRVTRRAREVELPAEVQLDSDLLPTDLHLAESKEAVRRVALKCRPGDRGTGTLTLDPNAPRLDEFGDPVGGKKPSPVVKLDFTLKLVKKDPHRRLFEVRGPKIESRLFLAVYRDSMPWGNARLLVHGKGEEVRYAINLRLPPQTLPPPPPPCHPGCFPAGTRVHVPGGKKTIERIRQGDLVTTMDAEGKTSPARVTGVFVTRNRVLEVRTEGRTLVTTATQPVGLERGGFRAAGELRAGDRIWQWVGDRRPATVTAVTAADREVEVFNLILGEPRGFIAGDFLVRSKPLAVPAPRVVSRGPTTQGQSSHDKKRPLRPLQPGKALTGRTSS